MKKIIILFITIISSVSYSQTAITDANFQTAINTCLSTNPVDGLCSDSEYGAMPDWDVSSVTDMALAFSDRTDFNGDISSWVTGDVTNMYQMFLNASSFNQPIGNWDVSSVSSFKQMFSTATSFNQNISSWVTSSANNMSYMFSNAFAFNQPLNNWDVSNVANMNFMFNNAPTFNQPLNDWDLSNMQYMEGMFRYATAFNQPLNDWDVSNVNIMGQMFINASAFNQDVSNWDITSVASMSIMFDSSGLSTDNYDGVLNSWSQQDVQFDVTLGVAGINYCNGANARQSLIDTYGWIITDDGLDCSTAITNANFYSAIDTCLSTNPVDGMCSDSEYGAMPDWDVSSVTDMSVAFNGRNDFNADISSWDVSMVTNMSYLFKNTTFNADISSWDVSSVTNMYQMFYLTTSFNQPIGSWDVSNVTDMSYMFYSASSFNQNISNWCVTNIASEPSEFSAESPLSESNKPVWGTCPTASVDDQNQLDISIYPNPTSDMVYIDGNYTQLKVVVYDILGKQVMNKSITNSIDISQLNKGVYILQLSDGAKLTTQRIIKN
jgi:surface protein